ncbi:MAG: amino-acid N-acetyltransferase [Burkholderiales bacterium]|nr:amino-acid N-acetyltransferase [Burkholderiales bacterium]
MNKASRVVAAAQLKEEQFVSLIRASAPFIYTHRDRTFVIAFGGEVVVDGKFVELTHDLNLLVSLGCRLVLVHGARPQVEAKLKERGVKPRYMKNRRVTDPVALQCVKEAMGTLRVEIEALLSLGLANSPMAGADIRVGSGNFVTAKPVGVVDGTDFQHTGEVRKIDVEAIRRRLDLEETVLISPLGYSPTGEIFNLTLEDVATSVAVALKADKLIFLMETAGVMDRKGHLQSELTAQQAEAIVAVDGMQPEDVAIYLPCAARACRQGVGRAHLISRHIDGAILMELFTHGGVGTMVTREPLEILRPASIDDVGGLLRIIQPLEEDGVLVKRNREMLEQEVGNFTVLTHDDMIIGCAALYPFPGEQAAELACLAVDPVFRNTGKGEQMLSHMEKRAREQGFKNLFVLSARTAHWFVERGFAEADVERLPSEKQALYNYQRRSKIFVKKL